MKLHLVITRDELLTFAERWLPLKLLLGDANNEDRYLLLDEPRRIELVAGAGLRISCRAQIRWPVLGLSVPVKAHTISVLFKPTIEQADGQSALVFLLHIEEADLAAVPARFDTVIKDAVNRALAERVKPAWRFGRMFTRSIPMPALLATTESIDMAVRRGEVEVTESGFAFEVAVDATTTRRALKAG